MGGIAQQAEPPYKMKTDRIARNQPQRVVDLSRARITSAQPSIGRTSGDDWLLVLAKQRTRSFLLDLAVGRLNYRPCVSERDPTFSLVDIEHLN
jgi:hypothetical protein